MTIKHEGRKWNLYAKHGDHKLLGSHETKRDAMRQEAAIYASKARRARGQR